MTYTSTLTDIHIKVEVYINRQGRYTETGKVTTVLQHESSYADTFIKGVFLAYFELLFNVLKSDMDPR